MNIKKHLDYFLIGLQYSILFVFLVLISSSILKHISRSFVFHIPDFVLIGTLIAIVLGVIYGIGRFLLYIDKGEKE
jgi:hypothetical protein